MENLTKKPAKGILKSSSSFEQPEVQQRQPPVPPEEHPKDIKWDEMNILQTLHPADKDYGHMKVDEPKTPYNYANDYEGADGEESERKELDPMQLLSELARTDDDLPKSMIPEEESDEDENLTEEEKAKKKEFEYKRKFHYNEFQAVKLARKLLEEEGDDDDEEDKNDGCDKRADTDLVNGDEGAESEANGDQNPKPAAN